MKPIDADLVHKAIDTAEEVFEKQPAEQGFGRKYFNCKSLRYFIDKFPTLDVAPVVHARWEPIEYDRHKCTRCGGTEDYWWADKGTPYCPWCAAKMDGGKFNEAN